MFTQIAATAHKIHQNACSTEVSNVWIEGTRKVISAPHPTTNMQITVNRKYEPVVVARSFGWLLLFVDITAIDWLIVVRLRYPHTRDRNLYYVRAIAKGSQR